ncbi:DUF4258 domain-containing protein [Laribacter hongkongensis]|uniref:DUF4258 domain-containing protein n=1 Tax=Laribacter hongkongensis TaxID=168471 RepID=A0ABD4STH7_9NEIS|nr:DUF4258 domain-containing protein [Laribacter hongkongensis]MCG9026737.1 DUF4258 domain-containing protein [Laribacter hongkongensis]MCG9101621.1 DUF4258 domain-containing protein [Laribacter hongkongensis]MCG9104253.1 DUF4258 domain-containing protein [Laribacter hongkongensis]MCG9113486.1 DUF4258 domain-containing protein [Laribacter hongkongensis]MCG9119224.1 DUF4258 domain-containing protein [Laribacter hongkongensis]
MNLYISDAVQKKLNEKHGGVTRKEIEECFYNREGHILNDDREEHRSDPPTCWFISETNKGRLLKVVFINQEGCLRIRTAYEPNATELAIYSR